MESTVTVAVADAASTDLACGLLWSLGTVGIEEHADRVVGHFSTRAGAERAAAAIGPTAAVGAPEEVDWVDSARRWARTTRVGHLVVRPPWLDAPDDPLDLDLVIDPGPTFGHGGHPTTRLILAALAPLVRSGDSILDVGCGSGVLAIAALRLGAGRATAIDIDTTAVTRSLANARINGVDEAISVSTTPLDDLEPARFDIVVANLVAAELEPLLDGLVDRTGRHLVVSGMLVGQTDRITASMGSAAVTSVTADAGWACLVACPDPAAAP